jgi:translation initiation factor IF-3
MVRCISGDGSMLGVISTRDAMRLAEEQGLDLVEISPNAEPPVCRIMDFGKFRYAEDLKKKQARKQALAHNRSIKEMKYHANVEEHDYATKLKHVHEFLEKGHKVKLSLQFRGRENAHRELGMEVVKRVIRDCEHLAVLEMDARMMGRSIVAMLGSKPQKQHLKKPEAPNPPPKAQSQTPAPQPASTPVAVPPPASPVSATPEAANPPAANAPVAAPQTAPQQSANSSLAL